MSDEDLVRRCLRGRPDAMRELVERLQPDVYALCLRLVRQRHDAEDLTQEVFLRVFRSLRRWDSTRPLRPWVLGIAVNRCRTWIGRLGKIPEPVENVSDIPARTMEDAPQELTTAIRTAVDLLRQEYREVFIMFHEQGQSYEEIALAVDRPVGTIKTWLHRARAQVLEHLHRLGLAPDHPVPTTTPTRP